MPVPSRKVQYKKKHRKDFHWEKQAKNPFHIDTEPSVLKYRTLVSMCILSVIATTYMLLYHQFFRISKITVDGLIRIDEQVFVEGVRATMYGNKFGIIPRNNYFFLNTEEMKTILAERFILEQVSILTSFPQSIHVVIQEKISTLIYDNGETYSYMGIDGRIVEAIRNVGEDEWSERYETSTSTLPDGSVTTTRTLVERWHTPPYSRLVIEMGEYPIIYDKKPEVGDSPQYTPSEISLLLGVQDILAKNYNLDIAYIQTPDNQTATFITKQGTVIHIMLDRPLIAYEQTLQQIAYNVRLQDTTEIDLRFGNRVYVQ